MTEPTTDTPIDPVALDLDACAREPIRIPGGIQPHGVLLVLAPESLEILQASTNAASQLGAGILAGASAADLLGPGLVGWVRSGEATLLRSLTLGGVEYQVVGHRTDQGTILEFEPTPPEAGETLDTLYPRLQLLADSVVGVENLHALAALAVEEVRAITGFNRVLCYSFDKDWHGTVIAESGDGVLPSYLGLRFPASDIPAQARELYRLNPLRLIPDAAYQPVPVAPAESPLDGRPLDMSFAGLRSVSPVHLEYMRNMGTLASMSISILVEDQLWGLISCHHATPRRVSPQARSACNFATKILALQIGSLERGAHAAARIRLKQRETELVARLSRAKSLQSGLAEHAGLWMDLAGADGAAILVDGAVRQVGNTPTDDQIRMIAEHLHENVPQDVFVTDELSRNLPAARTFGDVASGLVAASISQLHASYVMWFRPEVVRTVSWGGDPNKPATGTAERLHPRTSFDQWKEQVRLRAEPWSRAEVESVEDFRNALVNFVLLRAEERAQLTEELERSNKELEAFSYSVSHDLRAPFRHIVGYAELLRDRESALDDKSRHYLTSIVDSALAAGDLVDDLLSFSQLGRAHLAKTRVDMNKLVEEVRRSVAGEHVDRNVTWEVDRLPPGWGDAALLRQALTNLISNALKYSRGRDPAIITISGEARPGSTVYRVRDNGVGFDMAYVDKLFGVFQRLHRVEDFEGTGIGLALTKRVIDRHGGWIKAEGKLDHGATFTFGLPKHEEQADG
ncbi:GAF domain-containing protein [Arsenicitalea aurantiaca]|uniref:histidine kinase n=1 Tax=Arsenicitalea aurantiaca TaxID=1783274 RepID=A0A433X446_9HYPH|nr:ATP-binding protein [Arsenicitalea aurantiaca]RUT28834.1 GAF domain-containing protein [Arsenicitalea aurantiaca]